MKRLIAIAVAILVVMSGCAGIGVKFETYRIDARTEEVKTHDTSVLDKVKDWWNNGSYQEKGE